MSKDLRVVILDILLLDAVSMNCSNFRQFQTSGTKVELGMVIWAQHNDVPCYIWPVVRAPQWLDVMGLGVGSIVG